MTLTGAWPYDEPPDCSSEAPRDSAGDAFRAIAMDAKGAATPAFRRAAPISLNHFERWVQPELKVVLSGQLALIPVPELERWVQRHARLLVDPPVRRLRESSG